MDAAPHYFVVIRSILSALMCGHSLSPTFIRRNPSSGRACDSQNVPDIGPGELVYSSPL